jgi:hypothetical protein
VESPNGVNRYGRLSFGWLAVRGCDLLGRTGPVPGAGEPGTSFPITRWLTRQAVFGGIGWQYRHLNNEVIMATRRHGQIVETPTEARQGEPGPSVLALLTISTSLAVLILGVVWFVFFRT